MIEFKNKFTLYSYQEEDKELNKPRKRAPYGNPE